ncbi:MAG: hypothetical protein FIB08_10155 [Candidatus Methanoperedens sp.]|nr:hypothetical protein [Candidatus Methanoperedens sp.]
MNRKTITAVQHTGYRGYFMEDVDIVLEVDGKNIPVNDFVRKILCGMITGSVGSLRGVEDDWKTINIGLKR